MSTATPDWCTVFGCGVYQGEDFYSKCFASAPQPDPASSLNGATRDLSSLRNVSKHRSQNNAQKNEAESSLVPRRVLRALGLRLQELLSIL